MPDRHFAALREYADDAARQPDFDTIRQRAARVRRRRRHTASSVVAGLTAVVVAALALSVGPRDGDRTADPSPTPTFSLDPYAGWPRWADVVATRADELFGVFEPCRTCASELHVSADGGRTWSRRAVPPVPSGGEAATRSVQLLPLAPGVLVWTEGVPVGIDELFPSQGATPPTRPPAIERNWITLDGGRTWQRPSLSEQPVDAVPGGTRPVDCHAVREESPCRLYAVDPATGRFAPLANQPTGLRYEGRYLDSVDVPLGGRLWIPGLDPATLKPAVASSPDGGRTWHTHVFADGVPAEDDRGIAGKYLPSVAAGVDGTAHAMIFAADDRLTPYRTIDGGRTWQPVPGGVVPDVPDAGFVTADGVHVVKSGDDFVASRAGGRYEPVTLDGYPAELRRLTQVTSQQVTGRYVVNSGETFHVSDDGYSWRRADEP